MKQSTIVPKHEKPADALYRSDSETGTGTGSEHISTAPPNGNEHPQNALPSKGGETSLPGVDKALSGANAALLGEGAETALPRGAAATLLIVAVLLTASTLRSPITGVGSLIGEIQGSTGLSHTMSGMLTTLPLLAFAVFALAAPKLSSRFGAERTLFYCMILMSAGILLRSFPGIPALFGGTALIGSAIAIANVLVPSIIKRDFPLRLGLMTALYTSLMNMWSAIASGISMPLSRTALGWRGALACWLILSAATALVWLPLARRHSAMSKNPRKAAAVAALPDPLSDHGQHRDANPGTAKADSDRSSKRSGSVWRSPIAWRVTLFMGFQSIMFYVGVSWLPEILHEQGMSMDQAGWMLSLMQLSSMSGAFLMPLLAARMQSQKELSAASAALFLVGFGGIWLGPPSLALLFILLIGLGSGTTFSLVIMFFALRSRTAGQAAQLSGMAQSIGYLLSAVGPTLFGFIHDQTGGWSMPLATITGMSLITIVFGYAAGRKDRIGSEV
ncbi:CP family cyanate transporter-like MFS transporter [Fontibacillus phaseoli]|uniref:CP family cyanate transporter-like MFS transporter n=1 Tax=Fontibacillus phaseoli TaxID=1416533 RepID=A0A369BBY7_9BACL|nr:MFS transporter [Fontibacillus phaseoli]RCX19043.1 CP family cyanate transporter-like MFS transporter [Fontibacillus phaseoli]